MQYSSNCCSVEIEVRGLHLNFSASICIPNILEMVARGAALVRQHIGLIDGIYSAKSK